MEEMMEQINSQNPQGVVRGVLRATCPLFGDKKEHQIVCFYETSHIHVLNGPSKCDVKHHEHALEHVIIHQCKRTNVRCIFYVQMPETTKK